MNALFFRKSPRLSDWIGLGIFVAAYLAVIGILFLPRPVEGADTRAVSSVVVSGPATARLHD